MLSLISFLHIGFIFIYFHPWFGELSILTRESSLVRSVWLCLQIKLGQCAKASTFISSDKAEKTSKEHYYIIESLIWNAHFRHRT